MSNKTFYTIIISIIAVTVITVGITYSYFTARLTGSESTSTISIKSGYLGINYTEGDENVTVTNIYPRETEWLTKTFTLTGNNTTSGEMTYEVGLNVITNNFPDGYLTYDLRVLDSTKGTPIAQKTGVPINGVGVLKFGTGTFLTGENQIHSYELKIYFKDTGLDQNAGQGKVLNAKIFVREPLTLGKICTYNGELTQGAEFVDGQYTYRYMQERVVSGRNSDIWNNITEDGWGVMLTNKNSTDPVTTTLCNSINNKPIVSMSSMFHNSSATTLDLSSFDTSNVVNFNYMFSYSHAANVDMSTFDTSKVTNFECAFWFNSLQNLYFGENTIINSFPEIASVFSKDINNIYFRNSNISPYLSYISSNTNVYLNNALYGMGHASNIAPCR